MLLGFKKEATGITVPRWSKLGPDDIHFKFFLIPFYFFADSFAMKKNTFQLNCIHILAISAVFHIFR